MQGKPARKTWHYPLTMADAVDVFFDPRLRLGAELPRPAVPGTEPARPVRQPVDLTGCREVTVNAGAAGGPVRAELLTENGYRVRGFARADAVALEGDSIRHQAAWKDGELGKLPPGRYMLRFHLDRATVYAVTFQ